MLQLVHFNKDKSFNRFFLGTQEQLSKTLFTDDGLPRTQLVGLPPAHDPSREEVRRTIEGWIKLDIPADVIAAREAVAMAQVEEEAEKDRIRKFKDKLDEHIAAESMTGAQMFAAIKTHARILRYLIKNI
jgi:hypothetical protein